VKLRFLKGMQPGWGTDSKGRCAGREEPCKQVQKVRHFLRETVSSRAWKCFKQESDRPVNYCNDKEF
jgi:O-succinylbenzoate synthase